MGSRRWRRRILIGVVGAAATCLLAPLVSVVSNVGLPTHSTVVERLSEADRARLAEALRLRQAVGDAVWPAWAAADIPVILYNEAYAFLVGYQNPPDGWQVVPSGAVRGGTWEAVPGETFAGQTYYRQTLADSDERPQAFVVKLGEAWVASMTTLEWTQIKLVADIRAEWPGPLAPLVPYRLVMRAFGSDWHIAAVGHESFHALQGLTAPERVAAAERANTAGDTYPWEADGFREAWREELNLLRQALRAGSDAEVEALAQAWLSARETRREEAGLEEALIDYERHREWLEGLAKYAELELWRQGATAGDYHPLPEMEAVPGFAGYTGFEQRWNSELATLGNQAGAGETRFYYSGWAQAVMLDRLAPGWKLRAMEPGIWLEELVREAVGATAAAVK